MLNAAHTRIGGPARNAMTKAARTGAAPTIVRSDMSLERSRKATTMAGRLAAATLLVSAWIGSAAAQSGKITFLGAITNPSCAPAIRRHGAGQLPAAIRADSLGPIRRHPAAAGSAQAHRHGETERGTRSHRPPRGGARLPGRGDLSLDDISAPAPRRARTTAIGSPHSGRCGPCRIWRRRAPAPASAVLTPWLALPLMV